MSGPGVRSVFGYSRRYSPFEQIEGAGTDVRSDIFSLGATLFHLITGEAPVDVLARASAIVAGHPDPLRSVREIRPEVPEGIAHVLQKALALDPERRFHSAEEMRSAITTALEEDRGRAESTAAAGVTYSDRETLPVSAAPAGASYANTTLTEIDDEPAPHRAHNRVRRAPIGRYPPWLEHRAFLSAVAIIALLGIGYSIIWFSRSSNTDNTVLQQPQAAANVRSEPSVQEARPTISPDISEVAVDLDHDGDRGASTMRPKTEAGVAPSSKRREVRNGTTDRQRVAAQTRRGKDARRGRPVYEPPVSAIETIFTGIPPHERRLHQRVYPN